MLRMANKPIKIPGGITVNLDTKNRLISFKKGNHELVRSIHADVSIDYNSQDNELTVRAAENANVKTVKAQLGTCCAHIKNILKGLTDGFSRELIIFGTGYKGKLQGRVLVLDLGYSHDVKCEIPEGVLVEMPSQTEINLKSHCVETLGSFVDFLLTRRRLCRYKGKGIRDKHIPFVAKVVRKA